MVKTINRLVAAAAPDVLAIAETVK